MSNYFAIIKQNKWLGIRAPWTLDETVWKKPHKLGCYTGVAGGIVTCVSSILAFTTESDFWLSFGMITLVCFVGLIPCAYSVEYRKLHSKN